MSGVLGNVPAHWSRRIDKFCVSTRTASTGALTTFHTFSPRSFCRVAQSELSTGCCSRRRLLQQAFVTLAATASPRQQQSKSTPDRVFVVSDIHCDYTLNLDWTRQLTEKDFGQADVLLVVGDISDDLSIISESLTLVKQKFGTVFFVPGNHELWVRGSGGARNGGATDSIQKLHLVQQLCQDLGILTSPAQLGQLCIVPLLSWHHSSWDQEPDIQGVPHVSALSIADYGACIWPQNGPGRGTHYSEEIAQWFDAQNESGWSELLQARQGCDVISLAHFLPHQALLPEKRYLFYPNLAKAAGSAPLAKRLASLQPDIHLFGHTHFSWDATIQGVRYIQAPLCGPSERRRRPRSLTFDQLPPLGSISNPTPTPPGSDPVKADWLPVKVYESNEYRARMGKDKDLSDGWQALKHGAMCPPLKAHWSEHYSQHARDPRNVQMAPWVAGMYERRTRRAAKAAGKPQPNRGI